jgi:hypothetical protein
MMHDSYAVHKIAPFPRSQAAIKIARKLEQASADAERLDIERERDHSNIFKASRRPHLLRQDYRKTQMITFSARESKTLAPILERLNARVSRPVDVVELLRSWETFIEEVEQG